MKLAASGVSSSSKACPPPRVDRAKKPSRFRSAHERLFGRPSDKMSEKERMKRESFIAPDYINTEEVTIGLSKVSLASPPEKVKPSTNGHHKQNGHHRGSSYVDNDHSSLSSDSYNNKYGSPNGTMENQKTSDGKNGDKSSSRHDPYKFTRSTAQPVTPTKGSSSVDRKQIQHSASNSFNSSSAVVSSSSPAKNGHVMSSSYPHQTSAMDHSSSSGGVLKPPNYQSVYVTGSTSHYTTENNSSQLNVTRLNDGRPVPPPKPSRYTPRNGWMEGSESTYDKISSGSPRLAELPPPPPPPPQLQPTQLSSATIYGIPPSPTKKSLDGNMMSQGPPGYFATNSSNHHQPPPTRKMPPPSVQDLTYPSLTSTFTSARR